MQEATKNQISLKKAEVVSKELIAELEEETLAEQRDIGAEIFSAEDGHPLRLVSDHPEVFFTLLEQRVRNLFELNSEDGDAKARHLAENAYWRVFSGSPSLFNDLGVAKMLLWSARVRRMPMLARCLSSTVIGEMVYELSFAYDPKKTADRIIAGLRREKIPTVLDLIDQLSDVRNLAEYEDYAERASATVEYILESVRQTFPEVVVQEACILALGGDIVSRKELGVRERLGAKLADRVRPDRHIDASEILRFAPNAIAFTDKRGAPQYLASADKGVLRQSLKMAVEVHVEPIRLRVARELQGRQELVDVDGATGILQYLHQPQWDAWTRAILGKPLSELQLREQIYFAHQLLLADSQQMYDLQHLVRSYGSAAMRTFLSMEHDRHMGDRIIEFALSEIPEEDKHAIFALYGGIIDAATGDTASRAVAEKMGKAASDVLAQAHHSKGEPEKIRALLQKITIEGQALLAIYRSELESRGIENVTEMAGVEYTQTEGHKVVEDSALLEKSEALYRRNYGSKQTQNVLLKKFRESLAKPGAVLHQILFGEKLVAMMLVVPDTEDPKRLHISALNVDPELFGVKAGPELINKVLGFVREGFTLEAAATFDLASRYAAQFGFTIGEKFRDDDGVPLFKLELGPASQAPSSTAPRKGNGARRKSQGR